MQSKDQYKLNSANPPVGGNDIGGNQSADGIAMTANPSCDGNASPPEYNDPGSGVLKARILSMAALQKALQFVIAIFGTSIVGLGLFFSSASASYKAAVSEINALPEAVYFQINADGEEALQGDFEIQCISRHTNAYSKRIYLKELSAGYEYSFDGLKPNTEYLIKFYKDGKLIVKKAFKTKKKD